MFSIARTEELIRTCEQTLAKYEAEVKINPASLFNRGIVQNTRERLNELRANLTIEKGDREKELLSIRLRGKAANYGKIPLDLFGTISKVLSDCLTETSRQYQFGNKTGPKYIAQIKDTIDLQFERTVPGSTFIVITAKTNPDLFGNSIIENALINTFEILNADGIHLLESAGKMGGNGIKKLNELLSVTIKNSLEFDLQWKSPDEKQYMWEGNRAKMQTLNNSISKIQINDPQEIEFNGKLITQSLKGIIEIQEEEEKKLTKIHFPMQLLEAVKSLQIGDACSGKIIQKTFINNVSGERKDTYELKEILAN